MRDPRVLWVAAVAVVHHIVIGDLIGLGDAEALYVVYGRHLQGGYLDHPPLVGVVQAVTAALFGASPLAARVPAALAFGATILLVDAAVRALGGSAKAGLTGVCALLAVPMFFAGSLATTPDAILAPLVLLLLLACWRSLETHRVADTVVAGAILGAAVLAKVSAGLFAPGLLWLALRRGARPRDLALAALAAAAVAAPVVVWNAAHGGAMLLHRLVWTQQGAGLSWRNVGALVGGQLAYVGPPMLVAFGAVLLRAGAARADAVRLPALPALVGLALLGLWSRVAEPHWTAPALLPLVVGVGLLADDDAWSSRAARRLRRFAVGWAVVSIVLLHVLVLTPVLPALVPARLYDARADLANELSGWPAVVAAVRRARRPGELVAAGHYTMCAQLEVALGPRAEVTCLTRETDDWDLWGRGRLPPRAHALFVTDARYPDPPAGAVRVREVRIRRGGRVVREFVLWRL